MPARPGTRAALAAFDDQSSRLYLHDRGVTMLLPWPTMRAMVRRDDTARWKGTTPPFQLPPESSSVEAWPSPDAALARYVALIPRDVREAVRPFRDRHWDLLVFVARCGDAGRDLLRANPALGYMLAHPSLFRRPPKTASLAEARLVLAPRRKQRDILAWLGFPPTEPVRRLLLKISPSEVTLPPLPDLQRHLVHPEVQQRLAHLPAITGTVLRITAGGALPLFAPNLLRRVSELTLPRPYDIAGLATDTAEMWREVHPGQPLPCVPSFRRLVQAHHDLATLVSLRQQAITDPHPLPSPPVPGNEEIVPISTIEMLREEGALQDNCVASYLSRLQRRRVFVYRVLSPSRATLSIVRHAGHWRVDQLESAHNGAAPDETWRAVHEWLERARENATEVRRQGRRKRVMPTGPLLELLDRLE